MGRRTSSQKWLVVILFATVLLNSTLSDAKKKKTSSSRKKKSSSESNSADRCSMNSPVEKSAEAQMLSLKDREELLSADPQTLFLIASTACENQENNKCFVGFNLFREKFPNLVEGYSNAGVALERLGRLDDAKFMYRYALDKFPSAEKAVGPLLNVLQMEAVKAFDQKNFKVALDRYNEIVKLAPNIPDAYINLGNINEALQRYDAAQDAYKETVKREPKNVKGYNAMCRLLLMEVSGVSVGRFGITRAQRLSAFNDAKHYCMDAVKVDPNDKGANMNLGMLYKESLEFDLSIQHLKKALEVDPRDTVVLTNLATTLSRNDKVLDAVKYIEEIIKINDSPSAHFSIGTVMAPHDRLSKKALAAHATGQELAVSKGPRVPSGAKCSHSLPHRKLVRSWLSSESVDVEILDMVNENEYFGSVDGPRTLNNVNLADTKIKAIPLAFIDKQTIALTLHDVSMEGASGIMYSDCEVYLTIGLSTDIPRDYVGNNAEVRTFSTPVVSVTHPSIGNYYHFTAEVATRMLLSIDYYFGENGVAKDATLLLPPRYESTLPWNFLEVLGIKLKNAPIEYEPGLGRRYHFDTLHRIDWVQLNTEDPENNDMWSEYLPSRIAITTLRNKVRAHQAQRRSKKKFQSKPVVYICRAGVREIKSEEMLLKMLSMLLGDNLFIHDTAGRTGSPTIGSLQEHLDLFENAQVIMGAHGAGLINMIYGPDNMSVIEFPMTPHCNRCFGYVAKALDIDYWIVPEIATFYHLKYQMTKKKTKAALSVLRKVLEERGLTDLMNKNFDWSALDGKSKKRSKKDEL